MVVGVIDVVDVADVVDVVDAVDVDEVGVAAVAAVAVVLVVVARAGMAVRAQGRSLACQTWAIPGCSGPLWLFGRSCPMSPTKKGTESGQ